MYVDVAALQNAGILGRLSGPAGAAEIDYVRFVEESGFDYQRDLRAAVIGLGSDTTYLLGLGTFDWRALRSYAESRNGICRFSICRMPAYSRNRALSWGPLRSDVIAIASGPDQWAVTAVIEQRGAARTMIPTADPVWLATTGKALRTMTALPEGTRSFTRSLEAAQEVLFSLGASPGGGGWELRLIADCAKPADAARVVAELTQGTATLNSLLARENRQPNPADLSGMLAAGAFRTAGARVTGAWPLPSKLIETVMSPGL